MYRWMMMLPATFDDGSTTKTVEGVGTYTVAPDGTVTFRTRNHLSESAPAVTVVREDERYKSFCNLHTNRNSCQTAEPATDIQGQTPNR